VRGFSETVRLRLSLHEELTRGPIKGLPYDVYVISHFFSLSIAYGMALFHSCS